MSDTITISIKQLETIQKLVVLDGVDFEVEQKGNATDVIVYYMSSGVPCFAIINSDGEVIDDFNPERDA